MVRTGIMLGQNGKYDPRKVAKLVITDAKHRHRSEEAEKHTADAEEAHPLPADATDQSGLRTDPSRREAIKLTRGVLLDACECLVSVFIISYPKFAVPVTRNRNLGVCRLCQGRIGSPQGGQRATSEHRIPRRSPVSGFWTEELCVRVPH